MTVKGPDPILLIERVKSGFMWTYLAPGRCVVSPYAYPTRYAAGDAGRQELLSIGLPCPN